MSKEKIIDIFDFKKNKRGILRMDVEAATQRFRENLPKLVEDRRQEAARIGERYPSLEEIYAAEDSVD